MQGICESSKMLGAEIFEHTPVLHVERDGEALFIKTPSGDVWANHVVVASGVWSGMFFKQLGLNNAFLPVKGECLSVWNDDIPLTKRFTMITAISYREKAEDWLSARQ